MAAAPEVSEPATAQAPPKRPALAWYWRVLRILALAYVGTLVFLYFAQRPLIFQGSSTQGKAALKAPADAELIELQTASGEKIVALFGAALTPAGQPHPQAAQRPTLLFFYGNAMCLREARTEIYEFRRMGANVLVPEYVGYGMSSGSASEAGCCETADAAYAHLLARKDIDGSKIFASGWSLGGAVAIDLASRKPLAGLAAFSTFTRMADMGNATYPFLPSFAIAAILKHPFESERKTAGVKCPILLGHSRGDKIIPFAMSERLAAAATAPVTRLIVEKPDHDGFFSGGGETVTRGISEFVEKIAKRRSTKDRARVTALEYRLPYGAGRSWRQRAPRGSCAE